MQKKNIEKKELNERFNEIELRMFGVFTYKGKRHYVNSEIVKSSEKKFENDYGGLDFYQLNIERVRLAGLIIN